MMRVLKWRAHQAVRHLVNYGKLPALPAVT